MGTISIAMRMWHMVNLHLQLKRVEITWHAFGSMEIIKEVQEQPLILTGKLGLLLRIGNQLLREKKLMYLSMLDFIGQLWFFFHSPLFSFLLLTKNILSYTCRALNLSWGNLKEQWKPFMRICSISGTGMSFFVTVSFYFQKKFLPQTNNV